LTEILQQCADLQKRIAIVYRRLATQADAGHGAARLWHELALEEETHADILTRELQSFDEADDSGAFLPEYADRLARLERTLRDIEDRAARARSLDDALATAVAIEQSELEDIYDDVVLQSQPAFKLISERIEAALNATTPETSTPPAKSPSENETGRKCR
jgi:hypothetical protein